MSCILYISDYACICILRIQSMHMQFILFMKRTEPEEDERRKSNGAVRKEWAACNPSLSVAAPHVRGLGQGEAPRHPAA